MHKHVMHSRSLKVHFYGQAIIYNGAPGEMVKDFATTESFNASESEHF